MTESRTSPKDDNLKFLGGPAADGDLIAAPATASGAGAVGVVRLSGEALADCLSKVLASWKVLLQSPRTMVLTSVMSPSSGRALDRALAVFFPAPFSFTGEDCAEIHCHGGSAAPRLVLEAVLSAGARLARPGEFTQRAFLNGKMSLDQAEAVAELVAAQSEAEAFLAVRHLEGALSKSLAPVFGELKAVCADLLAALDFLDEEWTEGDQALLLPRLSKLSEKLSRLLASAREGRIYRDGLRVVLCGPPNAGKSSLLNALLGRERALVSSEPGTTRDYLEAAVSWGGIRVELVDTAGLREEGAGALENLGQDLARRELERSDVAVWLKDCSDPKAMGPPLISGAKILTTLSKSDLAPSRPAGVLAVSSVTGSGLDSLKEAVLALAGAESGPGPEAAPNLRQSRALEECHKRLNSAVEGLKAGTPLDIAYLELSGALAALGLVTGATMTEDLLEEVFSRFCLGK
ncbi:MAG: tRNA uridine-5-carboxymethylaminomethyl(34) synthesis GTPase MnmE [Deltaproteobacteria bacterium]|jgi:tRNA modification GTPase|nr:tRNA uridine-5-carboxymethylaminomethyl(34) synthesis GTPase MnmE [Deltaproteobacteria bacterium]